MTPLKVDTAIMCEFMTQSVGNKHTLVNVIPGELLVAEYPARIPVAFYFEVTAKENETSDYFIEIKLGRRRVASASAHIAFEAGKQGVIALPLGILQADEPGQMKVTIKRDGERPITLLKKNILRKLPT